MYEALQRLRFKSFYNSLGEEAKSNLLCVTDTICSHVQDGKDMTDIPDELTNIIDAYLAFVDVSCSDNPTYNFWSGYIDMVQLMLLHIRATRTSDWDLHLQTVRLMMPWFFVTDRVNYSRYLPCYWLEMINLAESHPCELFFFLLFHQSFIRKMLFI